jgi:hypothetical protein
MTMSRAILRAAAGAACLAAAFSSSSSSATTLTNDGVRVPVSGPIIVETRWLHPAGSSNPAIVGLSAEHGCCHQDDVYAIHDGLTVGNTHSDAGGIVGR